MEGFVLFYRCFLLLWGPYGRQMPILSRETGKSFLTKLENLVTVGEITTFAANFGPLLSECHRRAKLFSVLKFGWQNCIDGARNANMSNDFVLFGYLR